MIARIKFGYSAQERLREIAKDPEVYAKLKVILPNTPQPDNIQWGFGDDSLIDIDEDGPKLIALGVSFEVAAFKGTRSVEGLLPDRMTPCNVTIQVPHIGLLAMDEVMLEENCCTDVLQRLLDAGWRILCVCPPNAARRPDYILGRTKDKG